MQFLKHAPNRRAGRPVSLVIGAACAGLALMAASPAQSAPDISGKWRTKADAVVEISTCGSALCGKLVSFPAPKGETEATATDANNRDASKRNRKLLGLKILWQLKPDGDAWSGRIYDPRRGFSAAATVTTPRAGQLNIKGCVKAVVNVCKNEVWTKVN
ncbi:DUF2147 domain-containing protein [Roseibium sp. RKSG952]|uniref:DUF2147 domain-containing protein n=1 Tax=Roseibium sp. RKSG952 TaxID=2529384 RepID=UPI0012BC263E|nr:DUF2147 domain-containing protein [Roseibium sp. RKSG952]MTH95325.1 DUF2147 domain-containing protein [Roseibium sp. RKSG952]